MSFASRAIRRLQRLYKATETVAKTTVAPHNAIIRNPGLGVEDSGGDTGAARVETLEARMLLAAAFSPHIVFDLSGDGFASGSWKFDDPYFLFTPETSGTASFAHGYSDDAATMKLYDNNSGTLLKTESDFDGSTSMGYSVSAGDEYRLWLDQPFYQKDFSVSIDLPAPLLQNVSLDANGDATIQETIGWPTEGDYYKYVVPATGSVSVSADDSNNSIGFDTDLFVYNVNKTEVFRDTGSYDDGNWNSSGSLTPGTVIYFQVRQDISDTDVGDYNLVINGPALVSPTNVSASDGAYDDRVRLSWSKAADATAYDVWRATSSNGAGLERVGSDVTQTYFDDQTGTAGRQYWYWVQAKNPYMTTQMSGSDSGYGILPAPASVTASDATSETSVDVGWSAVSDASSYELWRSESAGGSFARIASPSSNSFEDTTAEPGRQYYYKAVAVNAYAKSASTAGTGGYRALSKPSVSASDGTYVDKVVVSWNAVPGASSYDVCRSVDHSISADEFIARDCTSFSFNDLTGDPGQQYYYSVIAKSATTERWSDDVRGSRRVEEKVLASVAISGPTAISEKTSEQYALIARYSDGSTENMASTAAWSENSPYIESVTDGLVTAGSVTADQKDQFITATFGGKSDTHTLTVKNVPDGQPVFTPSFGAAQITNGIDVNRDGYMRSFDIEFDVNSNVAGNYYVKVYEDDGSASLDDYLTTSDTFSVNGSGIDYKPVHINCDSYPGADRLGHGIADFRLDLYDAATNTRKQIWRKADEGALGNVKVEQSSEDGDPRPIPASVGGVVYDDANGNRRRDSGESGLSGWRLYLDSDNDGVLDPGEESVYSSGTGAYNFSGLAAGTYKIRIIAQDGWRTTLPAPGSRHSTTLSAGAVRTGKDFGCTTWALITGTLYNDVNSNAKMDLGESPLANWRVFLDLDNDRRYDSGEPYSLTTSSGRYSFATVAPGTYIVRVSEQSGWSRTKPSSGYYRLNIEAGSYFGSRAFAYRR